MTTIGDDASAEAGAEGAVVVGIDGSAASRAALRWAHEEAERLSAPLLVVSVAVPYQRRGATSGTEPDARAALERALEEVLGDGAATVRRLACTGRPVPVLLDVAHDARLLVIGSPETRRARDPWSGAVAALLPRQAGCPVVLVPAGGRR